MTVETAPSGMQLQLARDTAQIDIDLLQGTWSEAQYLRLSDQTNQLIEFTDGSIEVLPMPSDTHQMLLRYLLFALIRFVEPAGGCVLFAPLRLQLREGKIREPDILVLRDTNDPRRQNALWFGADLVVEIVSPDNPRRDTRDKVRDYAEAGIPEYWIVNPIDNTITVLTLDGSAYATHGVFTRNATATSRLLAGFVVEVDAVFGGQ
jgi:Uma2 family endonuclease